MHSLAATGCSGKAYVNISVIDTVSTITLATGAVAAAPIAVGASPGGLAGHSYGTHVYVANPGDSETNGTVSVIATKSVEATATIPVGLPESLNFLSTDTYVLNSADSTVSVIDTATDTASATIPVGKVPLASAFTPTASVRTSPTMSTARCR